jgi:hypothetical protein
VSVAEIVSEVEAAGVQLRLNGERIHIWYPEPKKREELADRVALLRANRTEVAECLRARSAVPVMPPGVRLVRWNLKDPPVAIETCSIVVDPARFAIATMEQLRVALAHGKRWVGWTLPQLLDRLAQVGVLVTLDGNAHSGEPQ